MSNIRVDPSALRALQLLLMSATSKVEDVRRAAQHAGMNELARAESVVSLRRGAVDRCQRALETCEAAEGRECSREWSELADARRQLSDATSAVKLIRSAIVDFESSSLAVVNRISRIQFEGQRYLAFKLDKVLAVNTGGASSSGGTSARSVGAGSVAPAGGSTSAPGLPSGFLMVPVSEIDQSENPVTGPQDFGKGYSIEDLDYAFDLLEGQILPSLAGGSTADSFRAIDKLNGSFGTRSLSDTYSGFFGGDAIRLERRVDGTYGILNGRHRVFVAGQYGRQYVPARIV